MLDNTPPLYQMAEEDVWIRDRMLRPRTGENQKKIKREKREATITPLQLRWEIEMGKAAWTRWLLPDVMRWVNRRGGFWVSFHLAQDLTGYDYLNAYLVRMGRIVEPDCVYYGDSEDTAEHTIFRCTVCEEQRETAEKNARRGR